MIINGNKAKTAVALGFFDGVHTAHREILRKAAEMRGEGLTPCVLLFDEHPQKVLFGKDVPLLMQKERRDALLDGMGLERAVFSFSALKDLSPEDFIGKILVGELNAAAVFCGYNYRFGKNGEGDTKLLAEKCAQYGIKTVICDEVTSDGEAVSSTRIRQLIEKGEVSTANELLGSPFGFSSEVRSGDRRGRLLGTPTINQRLPEGLIVPACGVYVSSVRTENGVYTGVTDIGSRPTFDGEEIRSETFILDFNGDLYGKTVTLSLLDYIRPEMRFDSADALIAQIKKDVRTAKKIKKGIDK